VHTELCQKRAEYKREFQENDDALLDWGDELTEMIKNISKNLYSSHIPFRMSRKAVRETIFNNESLVHKYTNNIPTRVNPITVATKKSNPKIFSKAKSIGKSSFKCMLDKHKAQPSKNELEVERKTMPRLQKPKSVTNIGVTTPQMNAMNRRSKFNEFKKEQKKIPILNSIELIKIEEDRAPRERILKCFQPGSAAEAKRVNNKKRRGSAVLYTLKRGSSKLSDATPSSFTAKAEIETLGKLKDICRAGYAINIASEQLCTYVD